MDGLLFLLLIGWLISKMKKKNKETSTGNLNAARSVANRRAERLAQIQAQTEKRKAQLAEEKRAAETLSAGEGESLHGIEVMEPSFSGSMDVDSTEGECICDPELEHERKTAPEPQSVYSQEIGRDQLIDFSPKGVLQGFVMNEIMTRPAQRARRR